MPYRKHHIRSHQGVRPRTPQSTTDYDENGTLTNSTTLNPQVHMLPPSLDTMPNLTWSSIFKYKVVESLEGDSVGSIKTSCYDARNRTRPATNHDNYWFPDEISVSTSLGDKFESTKQKLIDR